MTGAPSSALRRIRLAAAPLLAMILGCRQEQRVPAEAAALAARMRAGRFEAPGSSQVLPYRLFVPDGYDPRRAYPLVLYLHGSSGRGVDGVAHLGPEVAALVSGRVQALEPSFVLAPQCPPGREWVERHDRPPFRNYDQARIPESDVARATLGLLESVAARFSVDRARIYLTGFSMGGSGTWDLVTRHPDLFAAAIPITGVNDPSRAGAIADLPLWAFHGADDGVSPVANTRAMVDALRRNGSAARFTELRGVGHGCAWAAYGDVETFRWLLAQRRRDPGARR